MVAPRLRGQSDDDMDISDSALPRLQDAQVADHEDKLSTTAMGVSTGNPPPPVTSRSKTSAPGTLSTPERPLNPRDEDRPCATGVSPQRQPSTHVPLSAQRPHDTASEPYTIASGVPPHSPATPNFHNRDPEIGEDDHIQRQQGTISAQDSPGAISSLHAPQDIPRDGIFHPAPPETQTLAATIPTPVPELQSLLADLIHRQAARRGVAVQREQVDRVVRANVSEFARMAAAVKGQVAGRSPAAPRPGAYLHSEERVNEAVVWRKEEASWASTHSGFSTQPPTASAMDADKGVGNEEMAVEVQPAGMVHKDAPLHTPPPAYTEHDPVHGPSAMKTQFSEPLPLAVPGLWGFREGKERCALLDMEFPVDEINARAIDRWAVRRERFDAREKHVAVHVMCFKKDVIGRLLDSFQDQEGVTLVDIANAVGQQETAWPPRGRIIIEINPGATDPGANKTWMYHSFDGALDVTPYLRQGPNKVRIAPIGSLEEYIFCVHASTPDECAVRRAEDLIAWQRLAGAATSC